MSTWNQPVLASPEKSSGDPTKCHGFRLQCSLYFSAQESTSENKIAQLISLLTDKAFTWLLQYSLTKGHNHHRVCPEECTKQQVEWVCFHGVFFFHGSHLFSILWLYFPKNSHMMTGNREFLVVKLAFEEWQEARRSQTPIYHLH